MVQPESGYNNDDAEDVLSVVEEGLSTSRLGRDAATSMGLSRAGPRTTSGTASAATGGGQGQGQRGGTAKKRVAEQRPGGD